MQDFRPSQESFLVTRPHTGTMVLRDFSEPINTQACTVNIAERVLHLQNVLDIMRETNEINGYADRVTFAVRDENNRSYYGKTLGEKMDNTQQKAELAFSNARVAFARAYGEEIIVQAGFKTADEAKAGRERSFLHFWNEVGRSGKSNVGDRYRRLLQKTVFLQTVTPTSSELKHSVEVDATNV